MCAIGRLWIPSLIRSIDRLLVCLFAGFSASLYWDKILNNVTIVITFHMQFWICFVVAFFMFALYFRDTESLLHSIWWFICKFVSSIFILCSWCSILHFVVLFVWLVGWLVGWLYYVQQLIVALITCIACCCFIYQLFCCRVFVSCTWDGIGKGHGGREWTWKTVKLVPESMLLIRLL